MTGFFSKQETLQQLHALTTTGAGSVGIQTRVHLRMPAVGATRLWKVAVRVPTPQCATRAMTGFFSKPKALHFWTCIRIHRHYHMFVKSVF
jgi:hypothetical protein